ncbi:uncharacterized protein LOC122267458 [Penaeus japonicus]|uniref:uncharacterized protein LOC122267458 n=1 Tax=Penaeus japonicus TaxID=27405 RepID=UPI001C711EF9|nr:uncharacterized protein LOC122267458 [Penaeus japonicus]
MTRSRKDRNKSKGRVSSHPDSAIKKAREIITQFERDEKKRNIDHPSEPDWELLAKGPTECVQLGIRKLRAYRLPNREHPPFPTTTGLPSFVPDGEGGNGSPRSCSSQLLTTDKVHGASLVIFFILVFFIIIFLNIVYYLIH